MPTVQREKVHFASDGDRCAAWHYPGDTRACVVMAGGGAVTKEPGTDRFAAAFQAAGYTVLAFDYRNLGESDGTPRQVVRPRAQVADWLAAVDYARARPTVDPARVALWGSSLSGGHVLRAAARSSVAAVIAQTPLVDGLAAAPNALRHESVGVVMRFPLLALADAVRGALHRDPLVIPLAGPRGSVAMLTTPDAQDGDRALNPDNRYADWQQAIAARSAFRLIWYRPGRAAAQVACPLLVVVADHDQSALATPALRAAARRAPQAEVVRLRGGHYASFLAEHERTVDAELEFLRRHLHPASATAR